MERKFQIGWLTAGSVAIMSAILLLFQAVVEILVALHVRKAPKGVVNLKEAA